MRFCLNTMPGLLAGALLGLVVALAVEPAHAKPDPPAKDLAVDTLTAKCVKVGRVTILEDHGTSGIWIDPQGANGPMVAIYASKAQGPVIGIYSRKPNDKGMNLAISADAGGNPQIQVVTRDGLRRWLDPAKLAER